MKLNKLQRHTAYIIMLVESKKFAKRNVGLCYLINEVFDIWNNDYNQDRFIVRYNKVIEQNFPELQDKAPVAFGNYWFDVNKCGWEQRIKILKQCIEETY